MRAAQSTDQKVGGSSPSERATSERARSETLPVACGAFLLTAPPSGVRDRASEDVGSLGELRLWPSRKMSLNRRPTTAWYSRWPPANHPLCLDSRRASDSI
jgi:hypothetical protein